MKKAIFILTMALCALPLCAQEQECTPFYQYKSKTIYQGDEQWWHKKPLFIYDEGTYELWDSLLTVDQCDSVYHLHLTVLPHPVTRDTVNATICYGDSVEIAGEWLKTTTHDSVVLPKGNYMKGDSVIYRNVQVWDTALVVYFDTVPEGTSKVWYSVKIGYLSAGDHTFECGYPFKTIHGCDSLEVLKIHIIPTTYIDTAVSMCQGETFTFDNVTYTKEGFYTYKHHHQKAGDTIVTVSIKVNPTYDIKMRHTMAYGDSVAWQGGFITRNPGTYVLCDTSVSLFGCDSLTTLTLTVDKATQEIIWDPTPLMVPMMDSVVLDAVATSGLPVTYFAMSPDYAYIVEDTLIGVQRGMAMVEASQEGNEYYYPATSIRYMFTVVEGRAGLSDLLAPEAPIQKIIHRGHLYIVREGRLYTPDGKLTNIK